MPNGDAMLPVQPPLASRARLTACALLSGLLYGMGFCGYEQPALAWVCLVPVAWALCDPTMSPKRALWAGWLAGAVAHLCCYTWIVYMLRHFAFLPWPLAVLGYLLLCAAQSSLFGAWGWLSHHLVHRHKVAPVWALPTAMVLCEWLYPAIFPSYLSNSQYRQTWFIQSLDLWGPLGLTFLLTWCSALGCDVLRAWRDKRPLSWRPIAIFALVLALNTLYGYGRLVDLTDTLAHAKGGTTVGLVQTNMGIYDKTQHPDEGLRRHRDQSLELQAQGAQLVVWPESGYYYPIFEGTQKVKNDVLGPLNLPVLFGGLRVARGEAGREIYNSAFLTDGAGNLLGSSDKTFLLVFGEYLPLGELLPFLYKLSPQTSHFTRARDTNPLVWGDLRLGALICYEDILPSFVRRIMRKQPNVLVNLTNDAWFGNTQEPLIHLALATFRAVEQRRYLMRATNTGISAIVDPAGRIVAQSPVFARANVIGHVVPLEEMTFYARAGDWVGALCAAAAAWWCRDALRNLLRRRPRRARS